MEHNIIRFDSDIEAAAKFIKNVKGVFAEYKKLFNLAQLNEEDTALMEAAIPYLAGASLTLKVAVLDGDDNVRNWVASPDFEKALLTYVWGKVHHLRPELDNDAGVTLVKGLTTRCSVAYEKGRKKKGWGPRFEDEKIAQPIVKATAKRGKDFIPELTKIGKVIFAPENAEFVFSENGIAVTTGARRGRPIQSLVTVNYDELQKEGVSIPSWNKLTSYDREVLSIVSSLYDAGNEYLSTEAIGRALAGYRNDAALTPKQRGKIINALRVLRSVQITIDSSQEYDARYNTKALYEGALLPSERIEVMELNGQEVRDCVHIFRASPLYEYAKSKNQIARVDIKMLDAPINLTEENIILRGYLIRQVLSMKSSKSNIRPVILYDTLYELLELKAKGYSVQELRDKKKKVRDATKRILEYWIKESFIQGFEEVSEGRKIIKIIIKIE